jgi:hypothetical protein
MLLATMQFSTTSSSDLLTTFATFAILAWIISFAIRSALKKNEGPLPRAKVISAPANLSDSILDGPGRFRIVGVDRATKMDTTWFCEAQSIGNAQAKAELEGIVVTAIDRVMPE